MTTPHQKISALEAERDSALAARPAAEAQLRRRKAEAQAILAAFRLNPAHDLDAVLKARATVRDAQDALDDLGNPARWRAEVESAWVVGNFEQLAALLDEELAGRAANRGAYRAGRATEIGRLSQRAALAETPDLEAEAQLFDLEKDLAYRDDVLADARRKAEGFKSRRGVEGSIPLGEVWQAAIDAVRAVEFPAPASVEAQTNLRG